MEARAELRTPARGADGAADAGQRRGRSCGRRREARTPDRGADEAVDTGEGRGRSCGRRRGRSRGRPPPAARESSGSRESSGCEREQRELEMRLQLPLGHSLTPFLLTLMGQQPSGPNSLAGPNSPSPELVVRLV